MSDNGLSSSDAAASSARNSPPANQTSTDTNGNSEPKVVKKIRKISETLAQLPVIPANISLFSEPKISIHFPVDRSCGDLHILQEDGTGKFMGEAIGEVRVPPDTNLILYYNFDPVYGCSRLARLGPDALYGISFLGTDISDSDLHFVNHLVGLHELDISCTGLTDLGLAEIVKLTNLKKLVLSSTHITNEGVRLLSQLPHLVELVLDDTRINDLSLATLTEMTDLEVLSLSFTDITDRGLSQIKSLTNLKKLRLNSTAITNASANFLSRLSGLEELWLRSTTIGYTGLAELTKWLPHCQIIV